MVPEGNTPLVPLPKRSVARSFWSTMTATCRSVAVEPRKFATSVYAPLPAETIAEPSRNGAAGNATSWFGRPVDANSSSCASECSTVPVAAGGLAPAGIVTSSRSWNTTGSVTDAVRTRVPRGMVTGAAGTAASVKRASAVAARAPAGRKPRSLVSARRFLRCVAVAMRLSRAWLSW